MLLVDYMLNLIMIAILATVQGGLTIGCYSMLRLTSSNAPLSNAAIVGVMFIMGAGSVLTVIRPSATVGRLFESQLPGRIAFANLGGTHFQRLPVHHSFSLSVC